MAYLPPEGKIFQQTPYTVVTGGITTFETATLTNDEENTIEEYLNSLADEMAKVSPKIASDFRNQIQNVKDLASHFKARCDGKPYSPTINTPDPGQLGMNPVIPQFFNKNHFTVDVTEGTAAYMWGDATSYFTTTSTVDQRYMLYVAANGIIHILDTPVTNQFKFDTEKKSYSPFAVEPLVIETIEEDKTIYQYQNPAFPLGWDVGSKLSFMPNRTASGLAYNIIGIVVYEQGAFSALKWV